MATTYTLLLYHIVFSTKHREPRLIASLRPQIYQYMGGIVRGEGGNLVCIGGVEDHVHLLIRWRPDATISNLMRNLKSHSTGWIKATFEGQSGFAWQEGYSAFTVSKTIEPAIVKYIQNQENHHKKVDFRRELIVFLKRHDIEFDEKYLL